MKLRSSKFGRDPQQRFLKSLVKLAYERKKKLDVWLKEQQKVREKLLQEAQRLGHGAILPDELPINPEVPTNDPSTLKVVIPSKGIVEHSRRIYKDRDIIPIDNPRRMTSVDAILDFKDCSIAHPFKLKKFQLGMKRFSEARPEHSFLMVLNFIDGNDALNYDNEAIARLCISHGKLIDNLPRFQLDLIPHHIFKVRPANTAPLTFLGDGKDPLAEKIRAFLQPYYTDRTFHKYHCSLICNVTDLGRQTCKLIILVLKCIKYKAYFIIKISSSRCHE